LLKSFVKIKVAKQHDSVNSKSNAKSYHLDFPS
jgi:hypothetical protein